MDWEIEFCSASVCGLVGGGLDARLGGGLEVGLTGRSELGAGDELLQEGTAASESGLCAESVVVGELTGTLEGS